MLKEPGNLVGLRNLSCLDVVLRFWNNNSWSAQETKKNSRRSWRTCQESLLWNWRKKVIPREKLDTLKCLNNNILELISDKDDDDSIVYEVTEAREITDETTWAMVRIDSTLKSLQINSRTISTSSLTGNLSPTPDYSQIDKLELRTSNFAPNYGNWKWKGSMVDLRSGNRSSTVLKVLFIHTRNSTILTKWSIWSLS